MRTFSGRLKGTIVILVLLVILISAPVVLRATLNVSSGWPGDSVSVYESPSCYLLGFGVAHTFGAADRVGPVNFYSFQFGGNCNPFWSDSGDYRFLA